LNQYEGDQIKLMFYDGKKFLFDEEEKLNNFYFIVKGEIMV
jgi:CRP-like cAMP-binding protein